MPKIGENVFDVRLSESSIQRGTLKRSDFEKFLKTLPDESENAVWVDVEATETEED